MFQIDDKDLAEIQMQQAIKDRLPEMQRIAKQTLKYAQVGISGYRNATALLAMNHEGVYSIFEGCNIELSTSTVIHGERMALFHAILHGFTYPIAIVLATEGKNPVPMCGYCRQDYMYINPQLKIYPLFSDGKIEGEYILINTLIKPYMSKGKISHENL